MSEARRFMRFVIPGFVILFEIVLYLLIAKVLKPQQITEFQNIGSLLVLLCGIGFLCGIFYNTARDMEWFPRFFSGKLCKWFAIDHRVVVADLIFNRLLVLKNRRDGNILGISDRAGHVYFVTPDGKMYTMKQAAGWRILTAIWNSRKEVSTTFSGASLRADTLADIMHGIGNCFTGSIISFLTLPLVAFYSKNQATSFADFYFVWCIFAVVLSIFIIFVTGLNYKHMVGNFQSFVEMALVNDALLFKQESGESLQIHVSLTLDFIPVE